ncbi:HAMP domain-containing histidine kinase [Subsaxibacter sp. CAU 1640]|uniref:sensor histidine kinase n=1 Tax=Subsaxibacter sp. CAU 1640 TaxID=2933271 RepID=UPI002006B5AE|nr:HAMP domain-containing sensor histidine kinase [Subsaxibacter sp. CAU 1640]MCK7590009.1 HAMP domain-containing histidine kinase [Subsaxibacter sp. CAU 1640]
MFYIDRVKNRPLAILLTLISFTIITSLDYLSGSEMSFSIFYLIPVSILSVSRTSNKHIIFSASLLAAICWLYVDYNSKEYSSLFFPFWNAFVRLIIFITVGLLIYSFRLRTDAFKQSNKQLQDLNEEKNRFIGMAAHDIRNPVSGIYSFSDLLLSDKNSKMNEEEVEIVQLMKSLSQNVLDIIKNLLDVATIESGKIELNYKTQDYVKFVQEQIYINQLLANQKGINIKLQSETPEIVADFDSHYMTEVLNNLLSNAIKYSEKNSNIQVKISSKDDHILTEVIDKGQGIPLDEQKKLFNYFQKTSTQPTDGETSTGLGLAIVKKIVTAFKGQIGVKSDLNKGSNFYFTFPVNNMPK